MQRTRGQGTRTHETQTRAPFHTGVGQLGRGEAAYDRALAARDEDLGRRLADNANIDQQCSGCGLTWIWGDGCAVIHCDGCRNAGSPLCYCYYCKAAFSKEGRESYDHIANCRFNPYHGSLFPGNKRKEAIVKAHVRNAVEFLHGLVRSHSASVIEHAIRYMRRRFSDGDYAHHFFHYNYGIHSTDELYERHDFTDWFDDECRLRNLHDARHDASRGEGRTTPSRSLTDPPTVLRSDSPWWRPPALVRADATDLTPTGLWRTKSAPEATTTASSPEPNAVGGGRDGSPMRRRHGGVRHRTVAHRGGSYSQRSPRSPCSQRSL